MTSKRSQLKLAAVNIDGVLLDDTFNPGHQRPMAAIFLTVSDRVLAADS